MLVRVHLFGRAPGLPTPIRILPSRLLGSSCVAFRSVKGNLSKATHGAPVLSLAVGLRANDRALANDRVGVCAKFAASTESETPTLSL